MKIKNKVLLTSFLTLLLSLIALLLIGGSVIRSSAREFNDAAIPRIDPNAFAIEDLISDFDATDKDWIELADELGNYGYRLIVINNGDGVYSNDEHMPPNFMTFLDNVSWTKEGITFYAYGAAIVGKKIGDYTVISTKGGNKNEIDIMQKNRFEVVLKAFVLIGLASIAVILIVSQLLTSWLLKRIMRPVNALTAGARRIVQGNLSEPVVYEEKDELAPVCSTFNKMQSYLQEERERNASYEKARTDMIAGISHDLRTPLTSVKGYIKGLRDGVANTPEKQEQYLTIAYNKASEMDVLLQELFYFSKLETGNLPLSLTDEDLGDLVRKFVGQSKEELDQLNVQISTECISDNNPVRIDTEQMHRVLTNLVENAVKYAGSDRLTLTISVWREKEMIHLNFADNGKGVPEEQLDNLFIQFWRSDESRGRRDGGGSGLGLNIVKYIIEAHGGSVSARNDQGLVIDILLPAGKETCHE
ncbi:MAG: HAMP domain-containing sensor histidine kinase [Eubacteriales bacterium]|nr:HAMP domain-containing sensor histidine kinase [Eubacteriales bacterium]MDD3200133.1 HAMP domain-containing sensor histidine kinase [Eubacteriales bacterium]MDD4122569.1 HAMP domain-containing sensor histidine kinase [Eubacteriales bacterium]MDD4630400.1 HAMP domain-containing sensor histidine kinase [Eubacteriales bacterium]